MKMEESFIAGVPIDKVWDSMLNIDAMASCIPGVQGKTKKVDEDVFENVIVQKVAFIKVKFNTKTTITVKEPPTHLAFVTDGKDTLTGTTMNVKSDVYLKEISPDKTEISYNADVRVVGKLATFGEGVMRKKSKTMGAEIINNLKAVIEK